MSWRNFVATFLNQVRAYHIQETLAQAVHVPLSMHLVANVIAVLFVCALVAMLYVNLLLHHPTLWLVLIVLSAIYPHALLVTALVVISGSLAVLISSLLLFLVSVFAVRRVVSWVRRAAGW